MLSTGTGRILLVDDADLLVEMGASMLQRLGYEVHAVRDSLEALEIFRQDPTRFDLVITDQTMPRLTGTELARELAAEGPISPLSSARASARW